MVVMDVDQAHEHPVGTALVADDDNDFRQLLARRARRMGLTVLEVDDGAKALRAVTDQLFDVLVLDVYMPGATGLEVFQAARRSQPEIQAILLTGSASVETAVDALRQGAYDYLTKPLESLAPWNIGISCGRTPACSRKSSAWRSPTPSPDCSTGTSWPKPSRRSSSGRCATVDRSR
jgi:CheY-like chemotaxis protein